MAAGPAGAAEPAPAAAPAGGAAAAARAAAAAAGVGLPALPAAAGDGSNAAPVSTRVMWLPGSSGLGPLGLLASARRWHRAPFSEPEPLCFTCNSQMPLHPQQQQQQQQRQGWGLQGRRPRLGTDGTQRIATPVSTHMTAWISRLAHWACCCSRGGGTGHQPSGGHHKFVGVPYNMLMQ